MRNYCFKDRVFPDTNFFMRLYLAFLAGYKVAFWNIAGAENKDSDF